VLLLCTDIIQGIAGNCRELLLGSGSDRQIDRVVIYHFWFISLVV
jgi:hypothetical protein